MVQPCGPYPLRPISFFSLQNHQIALQWFCSPDARAGGGNRVLSWGQSVRCTWLFEKQVSGGGGNVPCIGLAVLTLIRLKLKLKWSDLS